MLLFVVTIFISFFTMLSLQNIHTISEEERKKRKAPSKKEKFSIERKNKHNSWVE